MCRLLLANVPVYPAFLQVRISDFTFYGNAQLQKTAAEETVEFRPISRSLWIDMGEHCSTNYVLIALVQHWNCSGGRLSRRI